MILKLDTPSLFSPNGAWKMPLMNSTPLPPVVPIPVTAAPVAVKGNVFSRPSKRSEKSSNSSAAHQQLQGRQQGQKAGSSGEASDGALGFSRPIQAPRLQFAGVVAWCPSSCCREISKTGQPWRARGQRRTQQRLWLSSMPTTWYVCESLTRVTQSP